MDGGAQSWLSFDNSEMESSIGSVKESLAQVFSKSGASAFDRRMSTENMGNSLKAMISEVGSEFDSKPKRKRAKPKLDVLPELFLFGGSQFNGITSGLRRECGGNAHMKGAARITASSTQRMSLGQCYRVPDYGWNNCWRTDDEWTCGLPLISRTRLRA